MANDIKVLEGQDFLDYMDALADVVIKPNAEAIEEIAERGGISMVCHKPGLMAADFLTSLGWKGKGCIAMPEDVRRALASSDHVTKRWLERSFDGETVRIFLFVNDGTMLLNYENEKGFWLEPNSTGGQALA